jgi:hypothetical protein
VSQRPDDSTAGGRDGAADAEDLLALLAPMEVAPSVPDTSIRPVEPSHLDRPAWERRTDEARVVHPALPGSAGPTPVERPGVEREDQPTVAVAVPRRRVVDPGAGPAGGERVPAGGAGPAIGIGQRFQPVAAAALVRPPAGAGRREARMTAAPGSPVHAVTAGVITAVSTAVAGTGESGVLVRGADRRSYAYQGLADPVRAVEGATVAAGEIIGTVGRGAVLTVGIAAPGGALLDAVDELVGLPDPNELGYAAVGAGMGVDPDELDRELAAAQGAG